MKTFKHILLAAVAYGRRLPAKKLRNGLFVLAAFAGLAGLIGLTDPPRSGAAASSGAPVTVINTPLPISPTGTQTVAGTVSISGTPGVNVMNTPNVNVANSPSVSLLGTPTVGLDPSLIADTPVLGVKGLRIIIPNFNPFTLYPHCVDVTDSCTSLSEPVPSGLGDESLIDLVTIKMGAYTGAKAYPAVFQVTTGANTASYYFPLVLTVDDGRGTTFALTQQVKLHVPASSTITLTCSTNTGNFVSCVSTLNGVRNPVLP